ncbi:MAG TPA: outer membrane beta-barrel protein [Candidatus Sulfotelmatobacter sp.]|nr:outer membrane beta-barrel protein [Candidatus Sulfotelmatobacter sp.]
MGRILAGFLFLLYLGPVTFGQTSNDRVELFGGYSLVTGDFTGTFGDRNFHLLNGWEGSAAYKTNRWFGIAADFSGFYVGYTPPGLGTYELRARSLSYLFGPQISLPLPRITPFAHFLLGATHINYSYGSGCGTGILCAPTSANSFTYAAGGGVDVTLAKHLALRGQVDLLHSGFSNSDNQLTYKYHETNARISTGIVFRF